MCGFVPVRGLRCLRSARICSTSDFRVDVAGPRAERDIEYCVWLLVVAGCPNLQHIDLSYFEGAWSAIARDIEYCLCVLCCVLVVAGCPNLQHINLSKLWGHSQRRGSSWHSARSLLWAARICSTSTVKVASRLSDKRAFGH